MDTMAFFGVVFIQNIAGMLAIPTPVESVWQVQKLAHSPEAQSFMETGLLEIFWCPIKGYGPDLSLQ